MLQLISSWKDLQKKRDVKMVMFIGVKSFLRHSEKELARRMISFYSQRELKHADHYSYRQYFQILLKLLIVMKKMNK